MSKSKEKHQSSEYEMKVGDFVKMLELLMKLYDISSTDNANIVAFIKEFVRILRYHKRMSGNRFLKLMQDAVFWESKPPRFKGSTREQDIMSALPMSFEDIRIMLSEGTWTKDEMICIAENQFEFTRGTLQKLRKEKIRDRIEDAMQNIETLRAIRKKAGE